MAGEFNPYQPDDQNRLFVQWASTPDRSVDSVSADDGR
jgi:hypothetical protein